MNAAEILRGKGKRVAIVQSSYIPWKGYFDLIALADEFILYDDVQYTRRDWRNRNRIKTANGPIWLTIPVDTKGKYHQLIQDVVVKDPRWNEKHLRSVSHHLGRAGRFGEYQDFVIDLYTKATSRYLSEVNFHFLTSICELLKIRTPLKWSHDYPTRGAKTERLVELCLAASATEYISGPSARAYMRDELFEQAGIHLTYMDYCGYPEYDQLFPPFEHHVSILDLILNVGSEARRYMKA